MAKRKPKPQSRELKDYLVRAEFEGDKCISAHVVCGQLFPARMLALGRLFTQTAYKSLEAMGLQHEILALNKEISELKYGEKP